MNKVELIAKVAEKSKLSKKDSELAVKAFIESIEESLEAGDKVSLVGFGSFEVRSREARKARNPRTGEPIMVPASKSPAFKPSKELKNKVNK